MNSSDIWNKNDYTDPPFDPNQVEKAQGFIKVLVQDGIPIFFYISGLAASYYNTQKKGYPRYFYDKVMRLVVPLLFSMVLILIPRLYFGQEYQEFTKLTDDQGNSYVEKDFFKYAIGIFPKLPGKISWLWYLPALFIDSNMNYPLLAWSQRR